MADGVEIVDNPVPEATAEEFNVEIVDALPQKDDATLALEAQLAEVQAANAKLVEMQEAARVAAPADQGFDKLAQELAKLQAVQQAPAQPEQPQIDPNALIKEVNEKFYDNPADGVLKLLNPIMNNINSQNQEVVDRQALQISKLSVLSDDSMKETYNKYRDEVEATVGTMAKSETVYREAIEKVRASHLDDIIAERVQAQLDEAIAKATAQAPASAPPVSNFTNATGVQTRPPADVSEKQKYRITTADAEICKRYAVIKGFDWSFADDQKFVIDQMRKEGKIK